MHAVSSHDDDETYEGPYAGDADELSASEVRLEEPNPFDDEPDPLAKQPAFSNIVPVRTLDQALNLAHAQGLDPYRSENGRWVGFDCPICKSLGMKAHAIVADEGGGFLKPECKGCENDIEPGILGALGKLPDNVVALHPERADGTTHDATKIAWLPLDLVTLGDTPRVPPAIGGLIYPGRRHLFWGESEAGKSWLAFGNAADELRADRGVVWIDLDYMGAQDVLERLRQFGVPDDAIRERFAFYQPDGPLGGYSLDAVIALMAEKEARLVVFDAFTGLCALHGLNPEKTIDIENAYRVIQPLCDTGAAVVILDHVVKNAENRGRYAAGSERKLTGADVAIGFTLVEHYGRGRTGRARLLVHKDRPAQLQRPVVGIFTLRSDPDTHQVSWSLEQDASKSESGAFRPTGYMERVSLYLEKYTTPQSRADVLENVIGKTDYLRKAIDALIEEGYVLASETLHRGLDLEVIKPFREETK